MKPLEPEAARQLAHVVCKLVDRTRRSARARRAKAAQRRRVDREAIGHVLEQRLPPPPGREVSVQHDRVRSAAAGGLVVNRERRRLEERHHTPAYCLRCSTTPVKRKPPGGGGTAAGAV